MPSPKHAGPGTEGPGVAAAAALRARVDAAGYRNATWVDFDMVRATLKAELRRDAGTAYGATNAGTRDDHHPCLPGPPDEEADLLFAALADVDARSHELGYVPASEAEFWRTKGAPKH